MAGRRAEGGQGADADALSGGAGEDLLDGNAGPNIIRGGRRQRFSLPRGRIGSKRFQILEGHVKLKLVTRDRPGRLVTHRARGQVTAGTIR